MANELVSERVTSKVISISLVLMLDYNRRCHGCHVFHE